MIKGYLLYNKEKRHEVVNDVYTMSSDRSGRVRSAG
ncbi:hypothetical protein ABMB67_002444 [Halalkalibacter oceani]